MCPTLTATRVDQNESYDDELMFAQASAATTATSRIAALPVSVLRNRLSGVRSPPADVVVRATTETTDRESVMP